MTTKTKINFWSVKTFRAVGLEARWGKRNGRPAIFLRNPASKLDHQRKTWWLLDRGMSDSMTKSGILEGFDHATLLGDLFSI